MTKDPITASPNDEAAEVAKTMAKERIGCVPVVDEGNKVVGIVTKYDYVALVARAL